MMASGEQYVCTLDDDLLKQAKQELNEKPEWRSRDIQALRDMINAHPGLHCPTDAHFLLIFLRARKFDYDRAYELLLNYYRLQAEHKELFSNLLPSAMRVARQLGGCIILPRRDRLGRRVIVDRPGMFPADETMFRDVLRMEMINLMTILEEEDVQVRGVVYIFDLTGFGLAHLRWFDPNLGRIQVSYGQDTMPVRTKKVIIVNGSTVFTAIFNIIRPFMKKKLIDRLMVLGTDYKPLQDEVGLDALPENLGGNLPNMVQLAKDWDAELEPKEALFRTMSQHYLDIPRKIVKKPTASDTVVDGLVGTYKKLNI